MRRLLAIILCGGGPLLWSAFAVMAAAAEAPRWQWETAAGFDGTVHTYALAVDDTTETISEYMVDVALEGRSARGADRRWRLRADASAGTELFRQRLDGDWRIVGERGRTPLRLDGVFAARQYRRDTDYAYSSDNWEARLDARAQPLAWDGSLLEARAWGGLQDYRTPSSLEVDSRQAAASIGLRSRSLLDGWWACNVSVLRRTYPDTMQISRNQYGVEADYDSGSLEDGGVRLHHKTERRVIDDPDVRPSAWSHWTDATFSVPAHAGRVVGEFQGEVWRYDRESGAWFDSWRVNGLLGYRWGDLLAAEWLVGLAGERLDAGDNPDTYQQWGLRAGVDAFGMTVAGSVTLEYGRRIYADPLIEIDDGSGGVESFALYSDFNYWKLWLTGSWRLGPSVSLEALASYEPERHTEQSDDSSLGFMTLRLVWRP